MLELPTIARALEDESAERILAWAAEHLPRLTFATGFGAEGCVIIDLIARAGLPIDLFTLDTGVLFPETYALWRQLEERYGVTIRAVRAEQPEPQLWLRDSEACCEQRK